VISHSDDKASLVYSFHLKIRMSGISQCELSQNQDSLHFRNPVFSLTDITIIKLSYISYRADWCCGKALNFNLLVTMFCFRSGYRLS
jgi:hypothetical protein